MNNRIMLFLTGPKNPASEAGDFNDVYINLAKALIKAKKIDKAVFVYNGRYPENKKARKQKSKKTDIEIHFIDS